MRDSNWVYVLNMEVAMQNSEIKALYGLKSVL